MSAQTAHRRISMLHAVWMAQRSDLCNGAVACLVFNQSGAEPIANQRGAGILQYATAAASAPTGAILFQDKAVTVVLPTGSANLAFGTTVNLEGSDVTLTVSDSVDALAAAIAASTITPLALVSKEMPLQVGDFADDVRRTAVDGKEPIVDGSMITAAMLAPKDGPALDELRKVSAACSMCMKRLVIPTLTAAFATAYKKKSDTLPLTCGELSTKVQRATAAPNTLEGLAALDNKGFASAADAPAVFSPNVVYEGVSVNALKTPDPAAQIGASAVTVAYGSVLNGMNAYVARTFIDEERSPKDVIAAVKFVQKVSDFVTGQIAVGMTGIQIHEATHKFAVATDAALARHLYKDYGYSTGLLRLDARGIFGEKGTQAVGRSTAHIVRVALVDLPLASGSKFTFVTADTVIVGADDKVKVMTVVSPSLDVPAAEDEDGAAKQPREYRTMNLRATTLADDRNVSRSDRLRQVFADRHAKWLAAGSPRGGQDAAMQEEYKQSELGLLGKGALSPYPTWDAAPANLKALKADIALDSKACALWVPLHGAAGPLTPIHVAAISKCEVHALREGHMLAVTFHSTQEGSIAFRQNRTRVFIREAAFTSQDGGKLLNIAQTIKEMQAQIKARDTQRKATVGVVAQGGLKLSTQPTRLPQVKCRPSPVAAGRGQAALNADQGNLEAHENGFRFVYGSGVLDVLYDNVRFLIVQPSENDIFTIFHLSLKVPILVNKKKTTELQFVAEVMHSTVAVSGRRLTAEEEAAEDEKEQKRIEDTNRQFVLFGTRVADRSGIPLQQALGGVRFDGQTSKGLVSLRGNERAVWGISEQPFIVHSMEHVEVAALERVTHGQANFDLVLVNNDYRTTNMVSTIPFKSLELVKDWLLRCSCPYFEIVVNIGWAALLREIRDDAEWEPYAPGEGWSSVADDMAGEEADDEDEEFEEGEEEDEDTDSDEDSDSDSDMASWGSSESAESDSDEDDESSAASWDELDRKARRADAAVSSASDDSSDRGRRRGRSGAAAKAGQRAPAPPRGVAPAGGAPRAPTGKVSMKQPPGFRR